MGKVDEEQIFYLMCRGLSRTYATHLIVEGFVDPLVEAGADRGFARNASARDSAASQHAASSIGRQWCSALALSKV